MVYTIQPTGSFRTVVLIVFMMGPKTAETKPHQNSVRPVISGRRSNLAPHLKATVSIGCFKHNFGLKT
jgi:hypothetical protein